jgi:hypothetical protein
MIKHIKRRLHPRSLVLLFAPSGCCLRDAENLLRQEGLVVYDIEDEMKSIPELQQQLKPYFPLSGSEEDIPLMTTICWHLPKEKVKEYWTESWKRIAKKFSRAQSFPVVIGGHAIYYSGGREEFFSPVDIGLLKKTTQKNRLRVTRVIVLIDDVYDMYYRLTDKKQVFDFDEMLERHEDLLKENQIIKAESMPQEKRSVNKNYLKLETKYLIAGKLLRWRASELATADIISRELKARFTVFAVKQNKNIFLKLVKNEDAPVVYISHPITRIRSKIIDDWAHGKQYSWPDVHTEINKLPLELLDSGVLSVSPTGIDELRIHIPEENDRPGRLSPRWGLQSDVVWKQPPAGSPPDYEDFPTYTDNLNKLDANSQLILFERQKTLLRYFFTQIVEQLAARDHLLVEHSDAILVYRGLYNSTSFSAGVSKELAYWQRIHTSSSGRKSRVIFVHFLADIEKLNRDLLSDYVRNNKNELKRHLETKFKEIGESVVTEFLKRLSQERGSQTPVGRDIDPNVSERLNQRKKDLLREVLLRWLIYKLTHDGIANDYPDYVSVRVIQPGGSVKALDLAVEIARKGPNLNDLEKLANDLLERPDYKKILDDIYPS